VANLTITIDDHVLRRARIRALEQGTSVNALVAGYLTSYADLDDARVALDGFLERTKRTHASSGPGGRVWRREDLYDL
jgi:hypothetical protein